MFSIELRLALIEREENMNVKAIRRQLRDSSNPLELSDSLYRQYYRVNKPAFKYLLDILTNSLPPLKQKFGVPPIVKLSACLRFFAEGGHQKGIGKDHEVGLSQSGFSEVLSEVLNILEPLLCPQWITWPTLEEQRQIAHDFYTKFGIPGVVGCVDGTHVNITTPSKNVHQFYNRKGKCSLNVMLVCDSNLRIRAIDATRPGACHDAFIWNLSDIRSEMEKNYLQSHSNARLLGDAGYPLEPWLLTPYRTPESGSPEAKFNEVHTRCRNIIERTNGVLKNRWRCLLSARELYYAPPKAIKIINVCAALHNICIHYKSEANFTIPSDNGYLNETSTLNNQHMDEVNSTYIVAAQRIRTEITNTL